MGIHFELMLLGRFTTKKWNCGTCHRYTFIFSYREFSSVKIFKTHSKPTNNIDFQKQEVKYSFKWQNSLIQHGPFTITMPLF